jgi:hypothetical protein
MTLLSVLRNGDHRFLPLLLSKVHDVLPRLVNPMLQTVPDPPASSSNNNNICIPADVDIFDGFGNAGMGVPSNFPGYNGDGTSGQFKVEPDTDFNRPAAPMLPFEKRIEELGSPVNGPGSSDNTPFASPPIIQSPMEFPGLSEYNSFPDLSSHHHMGNHLPSSNHLGNFGEGVGGGGRAVEFKQEYDGAGSLGLQAGGMGMPRRPPLRQSSGSSFGMQIQPPRSVPEQFGHLQRTNSNPEGVNMGMQGGMGEPFR